MSAQHTPQVVWQKDGTVKIIPPLTNELLFLTELVNLVVECEAHGLFITRPARAAIAKAAGGAA